MSSFCNAVAACSGRMKRIPEMRNIMAMDNHNQHDQELSSIVAKQKARNKTTTGPKKDLKTVENQESLFSTPCSTIIPTSSEQEEQSATEESFSSGFFNFEQIDYNNNISIHSTPPPLVPMIQQPIAPFDTTDRKRAYTSARYYGECFLHGISPRYADKAASEIQKMHQRWWVETSGPEQSKDSRQANQGQLESRRDDLKRGVSSYSSNSDNDNLEPPTKKPRSRSPNLQKAIDTLPLSKYWDLQHGVPKESEILRLKDMISPMHFSGTNSFNSTPNMLLSKHQLKSLKVDLLADLQKSGGCTDQPTFRERLKVLQSHYKATKHDARLGEEEGVLLFHPYWEMDGTWLTLSKPTFSECKGLSGTGDHIFSLGRMSFDMFRPANLTCSIQGIYNTIHTQTFGGNDAQSQKQFMSIPKRLRKHVLKGDSNNKEDQEVHLKTYNIVVAFRIEPNQSTPSDHQVSRPIRGIMTNFGYYVPDPDKPNRLSVWFTGGSLEVNDEVHDLQEWKSIFDPDELPKRDMQEYAKLLAAKILLGARVPDQMEEDGTMSYILKRPIGGHGSAYCDVLYMDDTLRIMQGHHGTIYVFSRVPAASTAQVSQCSHLNKQTSLHNNTSKKKMVGARMA